MNRSLISACKHSFSVIIPLYNKESSIGGTVRSVLKQTLESFELIVVNDGSTDDSLKHVEKLAAQDHRITIYNKRNGGVSSARNLGIEKSNFQFIAYLDADDTWAEDYLSEMCTLISKYPNCGMYGSAYKAVRFFRTANVCDNVPEGIIEDYFQTILKEYISRTSATVINREVLQEVGMFPVGMIEGEDSFMWSKIAIRHKFAFTPKVLCIYNVLLSGALNRVDKTDSCKESWYDLYSDNDFYRNEYIAKKAIERGVRHALGNDKSKSREIEQKFRYTKLFKHKWNKLYLLNRLPQPMIRFVLLYKKLRYIYHRY